MKFEQFSVSSKTAFLNCIQMMKRNLQSIFSFFLFVIESLSRKTDLFNQHVPASRSMYLTYVVQALVIN